MCKSILGLKSSPYSKLILKALEVHYVVEYYFLGWSWTSGNSAQIATSNKRSIQHDHINKVGPRAKRKTKIKKRSVQIENVSMYVCPSLSFLYYSTNVTDTTKNYVPINHKKFCNIPDSNTFKLLF